jgi:hypothetical protein
MQRQSGALQSKERVPGHRRIGEPLSSSVRKKVLATPGVLLEGALFGWLLQPHGHLSGAPVERLTFRADLGCFPLASLGTEWRSEGSYKHFARLPSLLGQTVF